MKIHPIITPASPSLASPHFDASFDSIESLTTTFTSPVVPTIETTTITEVALGYHRNQQYSITALTTSTGAVAERYAYTAYGQPTILNASGSVLTSSAVGNRYTYTGREWDETLGLHHFRARWMSPLAGRFTSRDLLGYLDEIKLYEYCDGMPFVKLDPSGEVPVSVIPAWIGRALLVRLGVITAGAAAGAIIATQSDIDHIFSILPWGGVAGQQVLSTWNSSWNDKGIGNARRPGSGADSCNPPTSGTLVAHMAPWIGIWGDSDFYLSLDYSTNGCDVTSLSLRKTMIANSIRLQVLKVVIESVETKDLGYLTGCCDCDPKCVGVQVALQIQYRGLIFHDTSSLNVFFTVCGDGSTSGDDDSDGHLEPHVLPIK